MAITRVSDSGISGDRFRNTNTNRNGYAAINEAASTNGTWSLLTNPIGDGRNYRVGYWSISGSVVITEPGTIDVMLVGPGAGGSNGPPGFCGSGGQGGPIARTRRLYLNSGTYAVTVGAGGPGGPGAYGGQTEITGPSLQANWTSFRSGVVGSLMQYESNPIRFDHTGGNPGAGGNPGGGGPGGGGQGGPGVNASGGPGLSVSGWDPSGAVTLGAGGSSSPGSAGANTGNGGGAGCPGGAGNGGSGRVYIRYQV